MSPGVAFCPPVPLAPGSLHISPHILKPVNHGEGTKPGRLSSCTVLAALAFWSEADSQTSFKSYLLQATFQIRGKGTKKVLCGALNSWPTCSRKAVQDHCPGLSPGPGPIANLLCDLSEVTGAPCVCWLLSTMSVSFSHIYSLPTYCPLPSSKEFLHSLGVQPRGLLLRYISRKENTTGCSTLWWQEIGEEMTHLKPGWATQ